MKRPIDGADLAGKLRTRKANAAGHPEAQTAYETAMNDAIDAEEITLNALRDEVYEDALAHGLWECTDREARELTEDIMPDDRKYYEAAFKMIRAVTLVLDESDELVTAANEESIDSVVEELADVVIQAFSTAGYLGIDIDAAVKRKMQINKGRPWKHGKE